MAASLLLRGGDSSHGCARGRGVLATHLVRDSCALSCTVGYGYVSARVAAGVPCVRHWADRRRSRVLHAVRSDIVANNAAECGVAIFIIFFGAFFPSILASVTSLLVRPHRRRALAPPSRLPACVRVLRPWHSPSRCACVHVCVRACVRCPGRGKRGQRRLPEAQGPPQPVHAAAAFPPGQGGCRHSVRRLPLGAS
jgi:hypothetical protein